MLERRTVVAGAAALTLLIGARQLSAARYTGPGVTDTEIRIGNTMAYSGSSAAYGEQGIAEAAYFDMINQQGGINGRKIRYLSRDDDLTAAKTVELTRQLVEQDDVLLMFGVLGSATNHSVRAYLNKRKVPQLFVPPAPVFGATTSTSRGPWARRQVISSNRTRSPHTFVASDPRARSRSCMKTPISGAMRPLD
jgi:branched-chain amino acid transport system substrate-binding protein